jgi:hypothetical protein
MGPDTETRAAHQTGTQAPAPNPLAQLAAFIAIAKQELGDSADPDLIRQLVADLNAQQRQDSQTHFDARQQYATHVAETKRQILEALIEYGLQTLKWTFLLNAGAIAIIIAVVAGGVGRGAAGTSVPISNFAPLLKAIWPFAMGCVFVVFAGASGYFNFTYAETMRPSAEKLHNFLSLGETKWPTAAFQKEGESFEDFYKRHGWKASAWRVSAITCALLAAGCFILGVVLVLRAALS